VIVASTHRTDSIDASLVLPSRLDHLVEVTLPDGRAQQEILDLTRARAETAGVQSARPHVFTSIASIGESP